MSLSSSVQITTDEEAKAYLCKVYADENLQISSPGYQDKWLEVYREGEEMWSYFFDRFVPEENKPPNFLTSLMGYVIRMPDCNKEGLVNTRLAAIHDCVNLYSASVTGPPSPPVEEMYCVFSESSASMRLIGPTGSMGPGCQSAVERSRPVLLGSIPAMIRTNRSNCFEMMDLAIMFSSVKIFEDLCVRYPETIQKASLLLRSQYPCNPDRKKLFQHLTEKYQSALSIEDVVIYSIKIEDFSILDLYLENNEVTREINPLIGSSIVRMNHLIELDKRGFCIDTSNLDFSVISRFDFQGIPFANDKFLGVNTNYFKFYKLVKPKAYCICCDDDEDDNEAISTNEEDYKFLEECTDEEVRGMIVFFKKLMTGKLLEKIYGEFIEASFVKEVLSNSQYIWYMARFDKFSMEEFTYEDIRNIPNLPPIEGLIKRGLRIELPERLTSINSYMFYRTNYPGFLDQLDRYIETDIPDIIEKYYTPEAFGVMQIVVDLKKAGKVLPDSIFTSVDVNYFTIYIALNLMDMKFPDNYVIASSVDCLIALNANHPGAETMWRSVSVESRDAAKNTLAVYKSIIKRAFSLSSLEEID